MQQPRSLSTAVWAVVYGIGYSGSVCGQLAGAFVGGDHCVHGSGAGAATSSFAVAPDMALAVDVSFADGFGVPAWKCGRMGAGPMIGTAPALNRAMTARLRELAVREGIPFQLEVMGGRTGTDAEGIAAAGPGVATALVSIPLRNMHTPVETICLDDVEHTARLLAAFGKEAAKE